MAIRPHITMDVVTTRFFKDAKDIGKAKTLVRDVLDCSNAEFNELHKFEEQAASGLILRAEGRDAHSSLRGEEQANNIHSSIQKLQTIQRISR